MTDVELLSEVSDAGLGKTIFGKVFQKVGQAAKVVAMAPIRAAWLASMKLNALNIAGRLRFGYAAPEVAANYGYNRTKWTMIRQQILRAERSYVKAGGYAANLKKAILTGNNRGRTVSLAGLEAVWQAHLNRSGLSGAYSGELGGSIVDLIGSILQALAAVLDRIKPEPVEDDEEQSGE